MQNHYNLLYREEEREMLPYCKDAGIAVIPWSPLARGILTGKNRATSRTESDSRISRYFGEEKDINIQIVDRVIEIAQKNNHTPSQVSLF